MSGARYGRLSTMPLPLVAYDLGWPAAFERERDELTILLSPWLLGGVHHIGSTAVPGLAAKPTLDLMAGIQNLEAARSAVPVLEQTGYRHAEHRQHEALWFYKEEHSERTHHLHLTAPGSDLWRERLAFRDALRSDDRLRDQYERLKQRLAASCDDVTDYTAGKRDFVLAVLRAEGVAPPV
jgi:GrpB-like predicted nucleotidyltransferase (UPF0157 family)